jgi:hypothetical protein
VLNITTETGRAAEEKQKPGKGEKQKRSLKKYLLEKMRIWINSLLEAERDEFLGRGRHEALDEKHDNYWNDYRPGTCQELCVWEIHSSLSNRDGKMALN